MPPRTPDAETRQNMVDYVEACGDLAKYQRLCDQGHDYAQQLWTAKHEVAQALFRILGYDPGD